MNVDVSPDGKEIVFDLLGDIYTLPIDGGEATILIGGRSWDTAPRYAPDGRRILIVSDRRDDGELWVVDRQGKNPALLMERDPRSDMSTRRIHHGLWSSDGAEIMVKAPVLTGDYWPPVSAGAITLQRWRLPVGMSADRRYVYFFKNMDIYRRDRATAEELVVLDIAENAVVSQAQLSRSGRWLAYFQRVKGVGTSFRIHDLKTGDDRHLLDAQGPEGRNAYNLYAFTPDDSAIVFWMDGKIWRVPVNGGQPRMIPFHATVRQQIIPPTQPASLTFPDGAMRIRAIRTPVVTPDGRTLIFTALGRLWVRDLKTGTAHRLTTDSERGLENSPAVSPDGKWIAYLAYPDVQQGANGMQAARALVMLAPLSSGAATRAAAQTAHQITSSAEDYGAPSWFPDSTRIAFSCPRLPSDANFSRPWPPKRDFCWSDSSTAAPRTIAPEPERTPRHLRDPISVRVGPDSRLYYLEEVSSDLTTHVMSVGLEGAEPHRHLTLKTEIEVAAISPDAQHLLAGPRLGGGAYLIRIPLLTEQSATLDLGDRTVKRVSATSILYAQWQNSQTAIFGFGPKISSVDKEGKETKAFHTVDISRPRYRPQGTIAIVGARLITMAGARGAERVIERGTLVVKDGRVAMLGERDAVRIPRGALQIDGAQLTLMPGLIDVHLHHLINFGSSHRPVTDPSAISALAYGITSGYDPSTSVTPIDVEMERAELFEVGEAIGPRHFYSGHTLPPLDYPINSLEDARHIAAAFTQGGAVVLKEYMQNTRDARQRLAQAAMENGVGVTSETHTLDLSMSMLIDGYGALEHMDFLPAYRDVGSLIAGSGVNLTPTVCMMISRSYDGYRLFYEEMLRSYPQEQQKLGRFLWPSLMNLLSNQKSPTAVESFDESMAGHAARLVAQAARDGGIISVGSHNSPGILTHWEMWALARGGMPTMEVLRAATVHGAMKIGIDHEVGTLEVGKLADFIVLTANPLDNIQNTRKIKYIVANGVVYDGGTLTELWPDYRRLPRMGWQSSEKYQQLSWPAALSKAAH